MSIARRLLSSFFWRRVQSRSTTHGVTEEIRASRSQARAAPLKVLLSQD